MILNKNSLLALVAIPFMAAAASAQEANMITLKSLDGKVVMTGELQGFEGGYYNIMVSGLGLIAVSEDMVTCQTPAEKCAALVSNS